MNSGKDKMSEKKVKRFVPKTTQTVNKSNDLLISPLSKRRNAKGFRKYPFIVSLKILSIPDISSNSKKLPNG